MDDENFTAIYIPPEENEEETKKNNALAWAGRKTAEEILKDIIRGINIVRKKNT